MKVDIRQIEFDPASVADPNGRVFHWEGGIYRGISAQAAPLYRDLLRQKEASHLFQAGLVETEISSLELEGYEFVLKHTKVPFRSYGFEWCASMYRDATLLVLDLSIELAKLGFELQDAHPWNVMFDGPRPVFIDFGSIVPIEDQAHWRPVRAFMTRFLNPLYLMSKGYARQTRTLRTDSTRGYDVLCAEKQDIAALLNWRQRITWFRERLGRALHYRHGSDRINTLMRLREIVQAIDVEPPRRKAIRGWDSPAILDHPEREGWKRQVMDIVARCRPKTLLIAAEGDSRKLARAAAHQGCTTVVLDVNEHTLQNLYREASRNRDSILPLLMDVCRPTPAYGARHQYPPATERLKCEMVFLSWAAVHRLVYGQGLRFPESAQALAAFSKKHLLVELVPRQGREGSKGWSAGFEWYHCRRFVDALRKHFSAVKAIPSGSLLGTLFLCTR
jgi:hypothetical protein